MIWHLALLLCSFLSTLVLAADPIHIKGSKFFTKDGKQWFVKGNFSSCMGSLKQKLTVCRHRVPTGSR